MAGLTLPPKVHTVGVSLHPAFALRSGAPQFLPLVNLAIARAARWAISPVGPVRDFDIRVGASYDDAVMAWSTSKVVAIDIETPMGSPTTITMVSVAISPTTAFVWEWNDETAAVVGDLLANPTKVKVGHNFAFDTRAFRAKGLDVVWPVADTIQAAALLWPPFAEAKDRPWLRLHWCAARVMDGVPFWKKPETEAAKALYRSIFPAAPDWHHPFIYCGLDALMTWRLWAAERELLGREGMMPLFEEIIAPAAMTLIRLEERGLPLDEDRRKTLQNVTERAIRDHQREVVDAASFRHTQRLLRIEGLIANYEVEAKKAMTLPGRLAACPKHTDYLGITKRAKCPACAIIYAGTAEGRAKAKELRAKVAEGKALLARLGTVFDTSSNDAWRWLLFDTHSGLGLKSVAFTAKTKSPQVDAAAIEALAAKHPTIGILKDRVAIQHAQRRLSNVLGVKADGTISLADPDGRVRFGYSMHRTETGRVASGMDDAEPGKTRYSPGNAQNIPDRDRVIYQPKQDDFVFVNGDWSQIEARVVAWLAQDVKMLTALAQNVDLHSLLAAEAFGIDADAARTTFPIVGETMSARDLAKRVRHGKNYGMGPVKGAKVLGIPLREATRLWAADDALWPEIRAFQQKVVDEVEAYGALRNPFGRLLRFHRFTTGPTGQRRLTDREEALAFLPQSTVGDMCKVVLPKLDHLGVDSAALLTTTHDSFLWECHAADVVEVVRRARKIMEAEWPQLGSLDGFGVFHCPADFAVGRNWGKRHLHKAGKCPDPCPTAENRSGLMEWREPSDSECSAASASAILAV